MKRSELLSRARDRSEPYDFIVIGGGATGAGVALDATARGFDVLLVEAKDFGSGTSSRSSKLVHGGVRYLAQGHVGLVRESLQERAQMYENAPHLVSILPLIVPASNLLELAQFWIGLKIYDWLSGSASFGRSRYLSRKKLRARMPAVADAGLAGAVEYFDGQFDDARYIIDLLKTAATYGATPLNYCSVIDLKKTDSGKIHGVEVVDFLSNESFEASARVVVNATGPFADRIARLDDANAPTMISPSQGVHLVVDRRFLPGDDGLLIPETPDGRIMFALPWHDHVVIGTTDTALKSTPRDPIAQAGEIELILETAGRYLNPAPEASDILALFAGVRPLPRGDTRATSKLSREHAVSVSSSGLISITGGKWTTYRQMAEDCVDRAIKENELRDVPCPTLSLKLHQSDEAAKLANEDPNLAAAPHADLPYHAAECVIAASDEMAVTLEDVLARRTRALFLNAGAAIECAPAVAELVGPELGWDRARQELELAEFSRVAANYLPPDGHD
ncbi:MAG: glycerol-3-phosphate dehydrogenase/oxidase [Gammaproteobacteria bacterium]